MRQSVKGKGKNNYAPCPTLEIKRLMFEREKLKRGGIINNSDVHLDLSIRLLETM